MKGKKNLILILIIIFSNLLISCVEKEEYTAFVRVVNYSDFQITDFTLKNKAINFSKNVHIIDSGAKEIFEIKWIGKQSALFGSMDNSLIFMEITYKIGNEIFNVQNEKDAKVDNYGTYYSEKEITNGTKINIVIENDEYEIVYE